MEDFDDVSCVPEGGRNQQPLLRSADSHVRVNRSTARPTCNLQLVTFNPLGRPNNLAFPPSPALNG